MTAMNEVTEKQLAVALERCFRAHPIIEMSLPKECLRMADLLGLMFATGTHEISVVAIDAETLADVQRWLDAA